MAGIDTQFVGEAWAAEGVKVGYLPQEPELEAGKTVHELVMEGMSETKMILDRFNEVSAKFAEEMTDEEMNTLLAEQAELQEKIDAANAWDLDRHVEIAMDALRLPPSDTDVGPLSEEKNAVLPYADYCYLPQTFYYLMSQQITLTPNL